MGRYGGRVWTRGAAIPGAAWAGMGGLLRCTIIDTMARTPADITECSRQDGEFEKSKALLCLV